MTEQQGGIMQTNPKHLISGENAVRVQFNGLPPLDVHPDSYLVLLAKKIKLTQNKGGLNDEKKQRHKRD